MSISTSSFAAGVQQNKSAQPTFKANAISEGPLSSQVVLKQLAEATGGRYYFIPDQDPVKIKNAFLTILAESTGNVAPGDPIAPGVVSNFISNMQTPNSIGLSWDETYRAKGYKLFRKLASAPDSAFVELPLMVEYTLYVDDGLAPNTDYAYKLYAYNDFGSGNWMDLLVKTKPEPTHVIGGLGNGVISKSNIIGTSPVFSVGAIAQTNFAGTLAKPNASIALTKLMPVACSNAKTDNYNIDNAAELGALFGGHDCVVVNGNISLNFRPVLANKTLVVAQGYTLNANSGLDLDHALLVVGSANINASLTMTDSSIINTNASVALQLNTGVTLTGANTIISAGLLQISGKVVGVNTYASNLFASEKGITVNAPLELSGALWSGGEIAINNTTTINGLVAAVGAITFNTTIKINLVNRTSNVLIP